MSKRQLRNLQQQLGQPAPPAANSSDEEEAETPPSKAPFNPFDLLTDDEDEAAAESDGEDGNKEEEQQAEAACSDASGSSQPRSKPAAPGGPTHKKSSKKKKKKGGKGAGAAERDAGADAAQEGKEKQQGGKKGRQQGASKQDKKDEEDIDAILQELDMKTAAGGTAGSAPAAGKGGRRGTEGTPALLGVDVRRLRGDDELRRIFGAGVIEAVDRQDAAEASGRSAGHRRYGWAPRNAPRRRPMKRGILVAPRDDWPYYEPGSLAMESAGTAADGTPTFRYVWPPAYRGAQALFEQAQGSYDPNAVAAVLHQCPYHVDALLAMSDLYRAMGEGQYAEESLNRALYALEAAWCPGFDPAAARCRLDIGVAENRALFVALFRHAQALSRRGCHSSALEVAKLLMALDPSDPLGSLQLIDYLALRAGRYSWLVQFVEGFDGGAALALLPNFAYSLALARFRQERQQQEQEQQQQQGSAASTSAQQAASDEEEDDKWRTSGGQQQLSSHDSLVSAMLLHPLVVPRLMAQLQGQGVGKDSYWKSLLERRLFREADDGGSATLSHLVSIFVERSNLLWKPQDVQGWMRRAADAAADAADGKAAVASPAAQQAAAGTSGPPPLSAEEWAAVARESFPAGDANDFRHLRLSDFSDAVNALPREELAAAMEGPGGMAGVQDVMDEAVMAQIQEAMIAAQQHQQRQGGGQQQVTDEELQGTNPLVMLLRSLLPWVDAGQTPDYGAEEQQRQGDGGGGGDANDT